MENTPRVYMGTEEQLKEHNTDELRKCLFGCERNCEDDPSEELMTFTIFSAG
jgi:hypothetical protein